MRIIGEEKEQGEPIYAYPIGRNTKFQVAGSSCRVQKGFAIGISSVATTWMRSGNCVVELVASQGDALGNEHNLKVIETMLGRNGMTNQVQTASTIEQV